MAEMIRSSHPSGFKALFFEKQLNMALGLFRPQKIIGAMPCSIGLFSQIYGY